MKSRAKVYTRAQRIQENKREIKAAKESVLVAKMFAEGIQSEPRPTASTLTQSQSFLIKFLVINYFLSLGLAFAQQCKSPNIEIKVPKNSLEKSKSSTECSIPQRSVAKPVPPSLKNSLCSTSMEIAGHAVLISCSQKAEEKIKSRPSLYKNTFANLQSLFEKLEAVPETKCRLQELFSAESACKVELQTPEEIKGDITGGRVGASYSAHTHTLNVPIGIIDDGYSVTLLRHETRHAADRLNNYLNLRKNTNGQFYMENELGLPYGYSDEYVTFNAIVENGINNLNTFYYWATTPMNQLTETDKTMLTKLTHAAKDYEPELATNTFNFEQNIFQFLMGKGFFDEALKPVPGYGFRTENTYIHARNGTLKPFMKYTDSTFLSSKEIMAYFAYESKDPLEAALLDGLYITDRIKVYPRSRHLAEINAFSHQQFEIVPELFDMIFPGLRDYHTARGTKTYRQCMKQAAAIRRATLFAPTLVDAAKPDEEVMVFDCRK